MTDEVSKYKDQIEQLKKENEFLKQSQEKFNFLNNMFSNLLKLHDLESIYDYISLKLEKYIPNAIILFNSVNEQQQSSRLEKISGITGEFLKKLIKISGFNPIGKTFDLLPNYSNSFKSGKLIELKMGLTEFSASQFPDFALKSIEKLIGLHKIYTIGILKDEHLLATIHFFAFNKTDITDISFIETFVTYSGIILQNKIAEIALKENEERLNFILRLSPAIIAIVDSNGRITYNSAIQNELLGFNKRDLTNTNIFNGDFIHPDDQGNRI